MQGLVGSGSRLLAWRPASLEPTGPVQSRLLKGLDLGLVGGVSFLQIYPWQTAAHAKSPEGCKVPKGSRPRPHLGAWGPQARSRGRHLEVRKGWSLLGGPEAEKKQIKTPEKVIERVLGEPWG